MKEQAMLVVDLFPKAVDVRVPVDNPHRVPLD
jgi:hypothetical protein